jgi:formylglycine-generating enzyme
MSEATKPDCTTWLPASARRVIRPVRSMVGRPDQRRRRTNMRWWLPALRLPIGNLRHVAIIPVVACLGWSAAGAEPGFRDCDECPTMVQIPAGKFLMGSAYSETTREGVPNPFGTWEHPRHAVTIKNSFAIGRTAVTRREFEFFVRDSGYEPQGCHLYSKDVKPQGGWMFDPDRSWRNPGFAQTDQHPVVCVSFHDAQKYLQWLSLKAKATYRLPTEAEWEYAARAGRGTARFWGDGRDEACRFANVADLTAAEALKWDPYDSEKVFQCRDGYIHTAPVGSFEPNPFGLYDMLGNVWQWVGDCFHEDYLKAPADGSAWISGRCDFRIIRGGSWYYFPRSVRSAYRLRIPAGTHNLISGFRVVRTGACRGTCD